MIVVVHIYLYQYFKFLETSTMRHVNREYYMFDYVNYSDIT